MSGAAPPRLDAALVAIRALLGPDGADVTVTGWDGSTGTLSMRLELASAECAECVVARPMLDQLLLQALRVADPDIRGVDLDDPRDFGPGHARHGESRPMGRRSRGPSGPAP